MLKVENLSRHFGDVVAVDDVSFEIGESEIIGLLGHNGAGKTTVMKLLTGVLEPDAGSIAMNEIDVLDSPVEARANIGYLPENSPLYNELSVMDYLLFAAKMRQLDDSEALQSIREAIIATDLQDRSLERIGTLSRGYQQRVGVAQAILHRPNLLILDEPTNGLDPSQTQHMRELIQQLSENATVILSTHIMQEVEAICDRVLILQNGKLVVDERLDELKKSTRVLLRTHVAHSQVRSALGEAISIESATDGFFLSPKKENSDGLIEQLVPRLVAESIPIQSIEPERRDLEALFRDVSEVEHAA